MNNQIQDINKMSTDELAKVCEDAQNHVLDNFSVESQKEVLAVMSLLRSACGEFSTNNVMIGINLILMMHALEKRKEDDAKNSTKH